MTAIKSIKSILSKFPYPVLNLEEFREVATPLRDIWGFKTKSVDQIISSLVKQKLISRIYLSTDQEKKGYAYLYPYGYKYDLLDIVGARSRVGYFSFYTALTIHDLTLQIPKNYYITKERIALTKNGESTLTQENIDNAFKKQPRISTDKRYLKGNSITLIIGQFQDNVGVIPYRKYYKVSDLERTLIDIAIRPFYAGGITQVLEAYRNAKSRVDIKKLFMYYQKMNLIYPYHQAIGFYMEKAGYNKKEYQTFMEIDQHYKFYLTYNMAKPEFSTLWNLYYPRGL